MKNIILLLCLVYSMTCEGQGDKNVSVFHRLLVYNSDNEVMIVKIKNTDVWVTPGFYQDSIQFIRKGLLEIASTYGMNISNLELKGTFLMSRENRGNKEMLLRNIYSCEYLNGDVHFPENQSFEIGEIKWLPMSTALSLISFESIRMFMRQTHENPDMVSGGSIHAVRENDKWEYSMVEEFYPLFK